MSHIISYTEEIEERGSCQQRPALETGDKYLLEVDGKKRLRIVKSVHFDRYVWGNVAQWTTTIEEFYEKEYTLLSIPVDASTISVFVANGLIGILSRDREQIKGRLVIPALVGNVPVRGVAPFGFYDCRNLTSVSFAPMVGIVYELAFAKSGIRNMVFNDELAIMVHITAVDGCEFLPKFDRLFDRPFPGMYLFRGGKAFEAWEKKLQQMHFLID
jgi:hypothetical protein